MFAESKGGPATDDEAEVEMDLFSRENRPPRNSSSSSSSSSSSYSGSSSSRAYHDFKSDAKYSQPLGAFHVGQKLDVLDSKDRWSEAEVLKIDELGHRIFVTFTYWESKWDEWISNVHERTAPLHAHTYYPGGQLKVGQRVEVMDSYKKWLEAFVIEEIGPEEVKVHFFSYHQKFDEAIPRDSSRIRPYGREKVVIKAHSLPAANEPRRLKVPGSSHKRGVLAQREGTFGDDLKGAKHHGEPNIIRCEPDDDEHTRRIAESSDMYSHYAGTLAAQGLDVVAVPGDGNCFFRSVSHQVYGTDAHHEVVRRKCMDYMSEDAEFFSQFVEGGMDSFPLYVQAKRQNACWGDDPEIQAVCELYDRPTEIWAYDQSKGARKLRTFHENAGVNMALSSSSNGSSSSSISRSRPLIRLSYYGGGHYDSITSETHETDLLRSAPGEAEDLAITRVRRIGSLSSARASHSDLSQAKAASDHEATELAALEAALVLSRREHVKWAEHGLDACWLVANHDEHVEAGSAEQMDDLVSMQRDIMHSVQAQSEQEYIQQALSSAAAGVSEEDLILEQVRAESMRDQAHGGMLVDGEGEGEVADPQLAMALKLSALSEEDAFALAIQASRESAPGQAALEDDILRAILEQSMRDR